MKMPNSHYTNYLISVQFERGFMPDTLSGKMEQAANFLYELGEKALLDGKRLHGTYSVVSGKIGCHAHFALSWLPLGHKPRKSAKAKKRTISRYEVIQLLEDNYFYVDNPTEAIKRVTHDKKHVTNYVIDQPKAGQSVLDDSFYVHPVLIPVYSEVKLQSYCSKPQMHFSKRPPKQSIKSMAALAIIVVWYLLFVISNILLTLF